MPSWLSSFFRCRTAFRMVELKGMLAEDRYSWSDIHCPSQRQELAFAMRIFSRYPLLQFLEFNKRVRHWIVLELYSVTFMHLEYSVTGTNILCISVWNYCVCYLTLCITVRISAHTGVEFEAECHNMRNSFCDFFLSHSNLRNYK